MLFEMAFVGTSLGGDDTRVRLQNAAQVGTGASQGRQSEEGRFAPAALTSRTLTPAPWPRAEGEALLGAPKLVEESGDAPDHHATTPFPFDSCSPDSTRAWASGAWGCRGWGFRSCPAPSPARRMPRGSEVVPGQGSGVSRVRGH